MNTDKAMPGQRAVYIGHTMITRWLTQANEHHFRVAAGLPADARLVRVIPDYSMEWEVVPPRMTLIYESLEWPPMEEGAKIPELKIEFYMINCKRGNNENSR